MLNQRRHTRMRSSMLSTFSNCFQHTSHSQSSPSTETAISLLIGMRDRARSSPCAFQETELRIMQAFSATSLFMGLRNLLLQLGVRFRMGSRDSIRGLKNEPSPDESLARFIFSKKHFSRDHNYVKHGAFEPDKKLEASVSRTIGLSEDQIWK